MRIDHKTYTSGRRHHSLGFGFTAKTAEQWRSERIPVVDKYIIERALGAHASEVERDVLAIILSLYQPLAVRILGVIISGRSVADFSVRFVKNASCFVARLLLMQIFLRGVTFGAVG